MKRAIPYILIFVIAAILSVMNIIQATKIRDLHLKNHRQEMLLKSSNC